MKKPKPDTKKPAGYDEHQKYPKPSKPEREQHLLRVLKQVEAERWRQDDMWGQQDHEDGRWRWILDEEEGEVAREVMREIFLEDAAAPAKKREELVQCAAVIVAWIQALDRREKHRSQQPKGGEETMK